MNPRNRKFFGSRWLGGLVLLVSTQAGRIGEDGSGAMWIAPELVPATALVETCSRNTQSPREVVFEVIRLEDHPDSPPYMGNRQGAVAFEWNAATGELSIAGTSSGETLLDTKGVAHRATTHLEARSCGS